MATVLVIDASASVRATLRIVLGHEHEVVVGASLEDAPRDVVPDVVVLGVPRAVRDERSLGKTLAEVAPGVPVLLLHAPHEVDVGALMPPQVVVDFLPKPFDAYGVRSRVRSLMRTLRAPPVSSDLLDAHRRFLEFPFLPHAAAAVVRRIMAADAPIVLLQGESGSGATAVARALHVVAGRRGPFTAIDAARLEGGALDRRLGAIDERAGATLYLAGIDRAAPDAQREILQMLDRRRGVSASSLHVVAEAGGDLGELASTGRFLPELAYAVGTLPVVLTPLRDRSEDVGALAEMLTRELCLRLGLEEPGFSPAALERLREYLWFGNVAELEAVLARTMILHRPRIVEADHLVFLAEDAERAMTAKKPTTASKHPATSDGAPAGDVLGRLDLEVVLGELAHELRNPMVTIKTFAQHLDSVMADPETRARFSALTTDAIGRMDELLETLLDFSRFREPAPQQVDVQAVLDCALAEQADELTRRHVTIERNGVGVGQVSADEAQVLFALRSLCRGLTADVVANTPIKIRGAEPGVLEMLVRTDASIAARLTAWVDASTAESPPLAWALAAALLRRNGGALTVRKGDAGDMLVRVDWTGRAG